MNVLWIAFFLATGLCNARISRIPLTAVGRDSPLPRVNDFSNHEDSQQRLATEPLPILNLANSQYTLNASFGTPSQNLSLFVGTRTPTTWVNSVLCYKTFCDSWGKRKYNSSDSATYSIGGRAFSDRTADWAAVSGRTSIDHVRLGDLLVEEQVFGEVENATWQYDFAWFDGVLGLGLPNPSDGGQVPIVQKLFDDGLIDAPIFSLYFVEGNDTTESELLLGGIDEDLFTGPLRPLFVNESATQWEVPLTEILYGGDTLTDIQGVSAVFDSMEDFIRVPSSFKAFTDAKIGQPGSDLCNRMDDLDDIVLGLGGPSSLLFEITPKDYIWKYENVCKSLFEATDHDMGTPDQVLLGTPFLTRWMSVFDIEERTISLAKAKPK